MTTFGATHAARFLILTAALGSLQEAPPRVRIGLPPADASSTSNRDCIEVATESYYLFGQAEIDTRASRLSVSLVANSTQPGGETLGRAHLAVELDYWPTAEAVLGPDAIAVAGKRKDASGETVIEIVRLALPIPAAQDAGRLDGLAVRERVVLWTAAEPGRDMVRFLVKNRARDALFVQFHDSGDLYSLELDPAFAEPRLTLVLSAQPDADVPHCPELADLRMQVVAGARHVNEGLVYIRRAKEPDHAELPQPPRPAPLWLFDHDADGALDEWGRLSEAEVERRGLSEQSLYTTRYLLTRVEPYPWMIR